MYNASIIRGFQTVQPPPPHAKTRTFGAENRSRSSLLQHSPTLFARPRNPELYVRPNTDPPPYISQFPKPAMDERTKGSSLWESSLDDSGLLSGSYEDTSTDTLSTKRTNPHVTDTSMPDLLYASPIFGQYGESWNSASAPYEYHASGNGDSKQTRREKGARQVVVALREDQLGQLVCHNLLLLMVSFRSAYSTA